MKREMILQPSLEEAILKCVTEDAIITSDKLCNTENIHYCNGNIYYEDGCRIGHHFRAGIEFLKNQEWTKGAKWYVIGYFSEKQLEELKSLHETNKGFTGRAFEKRFNEILAEDY